MSIIEKLGITPETWETMPEGIIKPKHRGAVVGRIKGMLLSDDENKANQILCAAAPEMLEALIENCRDLEESCFGRGEIETRYNPILEKATGKTWTEIKDLL